MTTSLDDDAVYIDLDGYYNWDAAEETCNGDSENYSFEEIQNDEV